MPPKPKPQAPKPPTPKLGEFEELVLLAAAQANRDGEASSVSIQSILEHQAERRASFGALYAALDRLERKGCVQSWLARCGSDVGGREGRVRRIYRVTDLGWAALRTARAVRERLWRGMEGLEEQGVAHASPAGTSRTGTTRGRR